MDVEIKGGEVVRVQCTGQDDVLFAIRVLEAAERFFKKPPDLDDPGWNPIKNLQYLKDSKEWVRATNRANIYSTVYHKMRRGLYSTKWEQRPLRGREAAVGYGAMILGTHELANRGEANLKELLDNFNYTRD